MYNKKIIQKYFKKKAQISYPTMYSPLNYKNNMLANQQQNEANENNHKIHNFGNVIENKKNRFNPYVMNQGSTVAVAGSNFVVVAGDTRLSDGYSLITRNQSKLAPLTDKTILASSGMFADFCQLKRALCSKLEIYDYKIGRQASTESIANLLSKTLYTRRFFPYYTFNLIAGLDKNGKGVVYGYDAIGSYNNATVLSTGSGAAMLLPYLDCETIGYNNPNFKNKPPLTQQSAVQLIYKAFTATSQRDIYTGDKLQIIVLNQQGSKTIWKQLRRD